MIKVKNILHTGLIAASSRILNRRVPLNVMLSVTNRCNGNCIYCRISQRSHKELTTKEIFLLIDQLRNSGTKRLGLWGGEPLIRNDIDEIIEYAKGKGMFVTMDSNGYLVPDKLNTVRKIDHLIIGLDGEPEIHDMHRGKGSHKKTIEALECIRNEVPVWTITVLTKYNLNSIEYILEEAKRFNFLTTFQVLHHNDILGVDYKDLMPGNEEYRKAISKLIYHKKQGAPIASSLKYLKYLLNWPDYTVPTFDKNIDGLKCQAGRFFCNIDADGKIYPCSLLVGKLETDNILDVGFKHAFESMKDFSCGACNASCYVEYNYLYSLNIWSIMDWLKSFYVTKNFETKNKI